MTAALQVLPFVRRFQPLLSHIRQEINGREIIIFKVMWVFEYWVHTVLKNVSDCARMGLGIQNEFDF